jgi:1-acyl-sn-glycerol-3-phosphate acyltransferase
MHDALIKILRRVLLLIGKGILPLLCHLRLEGRAHLTQAQGPLILVANHFSWLDPPVLALALPFAPAFLVASEAQDRPWVRFFIHLFRCVPIWRGQVDRAALRTALATIDAGQVLGIFPEGGVNPHLAERVARGETVPELQGNLSRVSAELIQARSGVALIAVMSQARILPVALLGTEQILGNLRRLRRTSVTIQIGPVFGPLTIAPGVHGPARRRQLDVLTDQLMQAIAQLLPSAHRGYYRTEESMATNQPGQEHPTQV